MVGVYKITSPLGKIYIGSSNDIGNRFRSYHNLKCKSQRKLYNSLKKYGVDSHLFEIVEECEVEVLLERELYYGTKYKVLDKKRGLNCRLPKAKEGYVYMGDETKKKIGESNKKINTGKKHAYYKSSLKKLTIDQVKEIKLLLFQNNLTHKEIGDLYGVVRKIISNINIGKTYSYVDKDIDLSSIKHTYVKLTEMERDEIKMLYDRGLSQNKIAIKYKVGQPHISRVLNNKR
jgi:group I intron endonuclease